MRKLSIEQFGKILPQNLGFLKKPLVLSESEAFYASSVARRNRSKARFIALCCRGYGINHRLDTATTPKNLAEGG